MISTSIEQGLHYSLAHPAHFLENDERNRQRRFAWHWRKTCVQIVPTTMRRHQRIGKILGLTRSGNTPTPSDAADCARSKGRAASWLTQAARFVGLSLVAVMFIGGISFWVIVPYALLTLDEPQTRTFERPVSNDTYARTQRVWRIEE